MTVGTDEARSGDAAGPGSQLATTLVAMLRTRLELLQEELADERENVTAQVRLVVIGWTTGLLAAIAGIFWIGLALPPEFRLPVLGVIVLVLAAVAAWTVRLRSRLKAAVTRPFRRLLDQLARDAELLSRSVNGPAR